MGKYRVGKSLSWDENFCVELEKMKEAGFEAVDFDLCKFRHDREKELENYKNMEDGLDAIKRSGLFFNGVHVSFGNEWDISALDEDFRRVVIERIKEIFSRCDPYTPYCYILHGSFEPIADKEREAKLSQLIKSLSELRTYTASYVCVEVLPRTCLCNTSKETAYVADKAGVGVCMDVNHLLQEKTEHAIRVLGDRIKTTHISDYDHVNERHWMPGEGDINWQEVIKALDECGYNGVWNYELGLTAPNTIVRERDFTYADFINNADELFNNKPLTVIGKRKENLGMW
ncbi:MAG: sugar phosphate isomerase/epimerase [Clostridiales bacterium]|nr:sugar phosphate isomerase/epimerase [Clostridiales bacterium]